MFWIIFWALIIALFILSRVCHNLIPPDNGLASCSYCGNQIIGEPVRTDNGLAHSLCKEAHEPWRQAKSIKAIIRGGDREILIPLLEKYIGYMATDNILFNYANAMQSRKQTADNIFQERKALHRKSIFNRILNTVIIPAPDPLIRAIGEVGNEVLEAMVDWLNKATSAISDSRPLFPDSETPPVTGFMQFTEINFDLSLKPLAIKDGDIVKVSNVRNLGTGETRIGKVIIRLKSGRTHVLAEDYETVMAKMP